MNNENSDTPASRLAAVVAAHLQALDHAIENLSKHHEGRLVRLPSWALTPRRIVAGSSPDGRYAMVRVKPDESLQADVIEAVPILSQADAQRISGNWKLNGDIGRLRPTGWASFGDFTITPQGRPLDPSIADRGFRAFGSLASALQTYGEDQARQEAVNFWN